VDLVPDGAANVGLPLGPAGFPQRVERRLSISVMTGSDISIEVAASGPLGVPAAFTPTSLVPAP
jgi:hypothetical protein